MLSKFGWATEKGLVLCGAVLMGTIALLIFTEVVGRFFFHTSSPFREELSRFLFICGIYLMAGVCWKRGRHIRLDFLFERMGERGKRILQVAFNLCGLFTAGLWTWCAILLVRKEIAIPTVTESMQSPYLLWYCILLFGLLVLTVYIAASLVKAVKSPRTGKQ